jgi:hypothetical protein
VKGGGKQEQLQEPAEVEVVDSQVNAEKSIGANLGHPAVLIGPSSNS